MTASLTGRLQTRLLLALSIGVPVTLLLAVLTDGLTLGRGLADLGILTALGLIWDRGYHALQQLRWDRDWPSLFQLLAVVPEALVAWPVLHLFGLAPRSFGAYALQMGAIWVISFLVQQGPLRVLLPHWRYDAARVLTHRAEPEAYAPEPRRTPRLARLRPVLGGPQLIGVGVLAVALIGALSISKLAETPAPQSAASQIAASQTGAKQPMNMDKPSKAAAPTAPQQVVVDHWDTSAKVSPVALDASSLRGSVQPVGLSADGTLRAPSDVGTIGWYSPGPAPGQAGASVLTGTASGAGAALAGLDRLRAGSTLDIRRANGTSIQFKVTKVVHAGAADFPTREVYTPTKKPSVRIIGATGTGSGVQDVIVFATASGLVQSHA